MQDYNPREIEPKWQKEWEKNGLFKAKEEKKRPKYYVLEMLPYPSGRLHMGHVRNYSIGDLIARYKIMQGFNVLHPIGWDAFGMPAENAAIKNKTHPGKWTFENIAYMQKQFRKLGISYDWDREVATCAPDYYKWEQLVFLKMYEKGIVTRKTAMLNWCDTCKTVLANEQAEGGKCWRCDNDVALKPMTQWFVRIPLYAEELLEDIDKELKGWPERVTHMQKLWIGKSEGALIKFSLPCKEGREDQVVDVFTTRPDTLFGATFMSLAAEHPLVEGLSKGTPEEANIKAFRERTSKIGRMDRLLGNYEKDGVFTGAYCVNPVTGLDMPVYAANFVLMDYGTGAVMAVPAHDRRDFEFAKKYSLPIKEVIKPAQGEQRTANGAYEGPGTLINSGEFTGMGNEAAKIAIIDALKKQGVGDKTINYKLKDWCISRQRYWGAPIPIVYCEKCGIVPVPEKELPVSLPEDIELTGEGGSPLAKLEKFINCKCPKCKGAAKRETDTMDTFVESSWYFLRYCSPKYSKGPVDPEAAKYWMPVDQYIGGIEHAVGHLLYCRFYMKVLRDLGFVEFSKSNEPVKHLLTQGMVTLGGSAMSKSRGNIVDPDRIIEKYGADTARLFILFASPPEKDLEWSDAGIDGCWRFLNRVWRLVTKEEGGRKREERLGNELERWIHKTIKRVTEDIERFHYNTAISAIMEYVNYLCANHESRVTSHAVETLVLLISPFAPHMAEELWHLTGHKETIIKVKWPSYDPEKVKEEKMLIVVQVNGKLRDKLEVAPDISEEDIKKQALASEKVTGYLEGKVPKKVIYVRGRLVSIVV
ncbi:MAG: leucine--tRNA ligase [Deltaproteobacteria bacterium CG11_big_fil_rev_8_21_14_0_20_49_13]|nr:MAG: leucine--tRNA ligase [Deltaproteobacteria bacterium CG11_big_fil_rev_8_21_14_0_20_49_13]